MRPQVVNSKETTTSGSTGSMKQSVSMTSLPPNGHQEVSEMALAKLRLERPYNSLKKKRNSERDIWRNSWGSGHSHSSCSIYSNATNAGSGTGKDDFWAALQTNYNYIMDTNLLDSCKEARGEIEGAHATKEPAENYCCAKLNGPSSRSHGLVGDPRRLRRWIRGMETHISKSPTLSEAIKMKPGELQKRLRDHSDLYREIVSQARIVGACIRASENTANNSVKLDDSSSNAATTTPVENRKSDGSLKVLERRYHLLYLKAIEIQCMLEGLLGRTDSPASVSRTPSDTDEEPVAKVAKFSDKSDNSSHINSAASKSVQDHCDKTRSDDIWPNGTYHNSTLIETQASGFDADSEGSDNETGPKTSNSNSCGTHSDSSLAIPLQIPVVDQTMETVDADLNGNSSFETSVTSILSTSLPATPTKTSSATKRTRQPDASKFNRSNRKSKNCAIFYFKHLDTDSENKDWSSHASEQFKSEATSEDDEWVFSNGNKKGDDSNDMDDSLDTKVAASHISLCSNLSIDVVDAPQINVDTTNDSLFVDNIQNDKLSATVINGNMDHLNKSTMPMGTDEKSYKQITKQYSKESIQQLVLDAETLVREEILQKTPTRSRPIFAEATISSNSRKKCDKSMPHPKIKRVQEWLQHQPTSTSTGVPPPIASTATTDCEASGEYTESDSAARDSDTSDGPSDSVATCLQEESNSQCTSTEVIGGSADPLMTKETDNAAYLYQSKVMMRSKRRNSERPWSVSCLSQLTQAEKVDRSDKQINIQGLANHSISESALNILSSPNASSAAPNSSIKSADSKNSLKRRRMRARKRFGRKSESGSNGSDGGNHDLTRIITSTLVKSESFSGQTNLAQDLSMALSLLSIPRKTTRINVSSTSEMDSEEEENVMMKPNFQLGAYTTVYGADIVSKLGSLAALANYNREKEAKDLSFTGTDNSNFSEQAWDNYQEKYMSEPYSEGFDSDAARRLLEFGDDYRNFLDSQSDCCSSLSAANNLDSLSPPANRQIIKSDSKSPSKSPSGDDYTTRRRRAIGLEYERRKKGSDGSRKLLLDECRKSFGSEINRISPKSATKSNGNTISRKLEMEFISSLDKRKHDDDSIRRRLRSNEKSLSSSSSGSESEDEIEIKTLLAQSKNRLENTEALRIRRHLLRPEDYAEIIATCRDNVLCLESVLRGPSSTVLSPMRGQEIREILSSWESLLHWSENASVARQLQEEMSVLKGVLNKLGNRCGTFDSETTIQISIEDLKNEKTQLHTHRSTMLRLNALVHSWLTRQEMKMAKLTEKQKSLQSIEINSSIDVHDENLDQTNSSTTTQILTTQSTDTAVQFDINFIDEELHKQLKNEVGDMYSAWDEADQRISSRLESLTTSLIAWKQFESGLTEFKEALGKDKGALKGLKGALEMGNDVTNNLAHDVKEVAKRLSEKIENNVQQSTAQNENTHLNPLASVLQFGLKSSSNGSLSDSGISDGGGSSDYGLSERERRLGALRRLARQLENALAPGSAALNSITQRMEAAEADLRSLQDTCRELIVRTAASQQQNAQSTTPEVVQPTSFPVPTINIKGKPKRTSPQSKRKNRRRSNGSTSSQSKTSPLAATFSTIPSPEPDPDDPSDETDLNDDKIDRKNWAWRLAKYAVPVQLALVAFVCAVCCLEPHCCDTLNNLSMSFTPQLRYVRGPPPI